jgi:Zn finger protein HypA/HybF involved in hydrogenase expression
LITASPTPDLMDLSTPVPRPTRSSSEVLTTWGSQGNLDVQHLHVESRCSECHHPPYVGKFTKAACPACHLTSPRVAPDDDVCLSCHGETRTGLTELTRDYAPVNPHDYHYGIDMRCDACHLMHEPIEALCDECHEDYIVSRTS